jgi:hypothetical protein
VQTAKKSFRPAQKKQVALRAFTAALVPAWKWWSRGATPKAASNYPKVGGCWLGESHREPVAERAVVATECYRRPGYWLAADHGKMHVARGAEFILASALRFANVSHAHSSRR